LKHNKLVAANRLFQVMGNLHDIESYFGLDNTLSSYGTLFLCHWGHLSIILLWLSRNLFHIGWNSNYELWMFNPINTIPIAHMIWDPHFSIEVVSIYSGGVVLSYSGIYNWLVTCGFSGSLSIYNLTLVLQLLGLLLLILGKLHLIVQSDIIISISKQDIMVVHQPKDVVFQLLFINLLANEIGYSFHTNVLMGFTSICWSGHLLHVAIPISRGINVYWSIIRSHLCNLSFLGGLKSNTISLYLTDIAHHLGVGVLFIWVSHL
jgi:photosystem I P700 chlorophyll a apoprotein A2